MACGGGNCKQVSRKMIDSDSGPLPQGYHERMSILVNQIMPLCEKAHDIAAEFTGEGETPLLELDVDGLHVEIRKTKQKEK